MRTVIYVNTAYTDPMLCIQQVAHCKQLAAKEGYHVDQIVSDAESDGQQEQPGVHRLRALIEGVEGDGIDMLIVVDYPDLAQQPDEIREFQALCQSHNVQIRTVNAGKGVLAERSVGE